MDKKQFLKSLFNEHPELKKDITNLSVKNNKLQLNSKNIKINKNLEINFENGSLINVQMYEMFKKIMGDMKLNMDKNLWKYLKEDVDYFIDYLV